MRAAFSPFVGALLLCAPASAGIELITEPAEPTDQIDLSLEEYVPSSGTQPSIDDAEAASIVRVCDELAAHPGNSENPEGIEGVVYTLIDGAKALPACMKAVDVAPDILRLQYQLARAKQASGQGRDAIKDLRALAAKDYVPAINNLGATYQVGIGVAKDYEKAIGWYEKAASQGFVPSMAVLGWMHHTGLGTPKDHEKALGWYRKAAAGGSASAMHNIGFAYHNGWSVEQDPDQAAIWFRKAADKGFGQAMSMTAWTYQVGRGAPVDGKLALEWYEKAAAIGEVSAFVGMGGLYDTGGSGIEPHPEKAAVWLLKALRKGHEGTRKRLVENPETLNAETRRAIQASLREEGFDPGPADGVFGKKTRDAIDKAFTAP